MTTPTIHARSICSRCQYCHYDDSSGRDREIWYNFYCRYDAFEERYRQDPVSGEYILEIKVRGHWMDLGCSGEKEMPHCRDINQDGECELYAEKKGRGLV